MHFGFQRLSFKPSMCVGLWPSAGNLEDPSAGTSCSMETHCMMSFLGHRAVVALPLGYFFIEKLVEKP